jgi:hypothetical protein
VARPESWMRRAWQLAATSPCFTQSRTHKVFMLTMLRSGTPTASRRAAQGCSRTGHVAELRHALRIHDSGRATRGVLGFHGRGSRRAHWSSACRAKFATPFASMLRGCHAPRPRIRWSRHPAEPNRRASPSSAYSRIERDALEIGNHWFCSVDASCHPTCRRNESLRSELAG